MTTLLIIAVILIGLTGLYLLVLRPWYLRWGATDNDLKLSLTGDNLVANPEYNATRGITISSTPDNIWKWIIQIGSRRAGWYSIDWIDNGSIPSSQEIIPEF